MEPMGTIDKEPNDIIMMMRGT